jgi:hypothetical protein
LQKIKRRHKIKREMNVTIEDLIMGQKKKITNDRMLIIIQQDATIYSLFISVTPRKYPYFDVVVGLVWSYDSKSYAGGSVCYW